MRAGSRYVDVSQKVTICFEACAMNSPHIDRAMSEWLSLLGTGHSATVDLVLGRYVESFGLTVEQDEEVVVEPEETSLNPGITFTSILTSE